MPANPSNNKKLKKIQAKVRRNRKKMQKGQVK
jgi:hypothetical protein